MPGMNVAVKDPPKPLPPGVAEARAKDARRELLEALKEADPNMEIERFDALFEPIIRVMANAEAAERGASVTTWELHHHGCMIRSRKLELLRAALWAKIVAGMSSADDLFDFVCDELDK